MTIVKNKTIIATFMTFAMLAISFVGFAQTATAACEDVRIERFAALPWQVSAKRNISYFNVRLVTTCAPADQNFKIYFETSANPGNKLFASEVSSSKFVRTSASEYEANIEVKVKPFENVDANTKTLQYVPFVASPQDKVLAKGPDYTHQTLTNASAQPPASTNPSPTPQPTQVPPDEDLPMIRNPIGTDNLSAVISRIIKWLLGIIVMAAIVMLIINGFRMIAYGGNPGELAKAKSGVMWAIGGLILALMSFSIVSMLQRLL